MQSYSTLFIEYLASKGYEQKLLKTVNITSRGLPFSGVKVLDKEGEDASVIQAFALMSDKMRTSHRLFPFYRTHPWGKNNESAKPSCSIATQEKDGSWVIYDAHDSSKVRDKSYLDFNLAVERFYRRADVAPVREIGNAISIVSWVMAFLLITYFVVFLVCPELSLPFDMNVISLFAMVAVLLLLPLLIPFIKGISIFGVDFFFKHND